MLKHLSITNFAIIDHIELDFFDGLTVLTGETGAGKSILIDAISLLLGDRASQEMIRSESDKSLIEATFVYQNESIRGKLSKLGISTLDNTLVISREINSQNKNTIKINQVAVSLQDLKDISKDLADVHSQYDTQRLINPSNYIQLIDGFNRQKIETYLHEYTARLNEYHTCLKEYNALSKKQHDASGKLEIYEYQFKELTDSSLRSDEYESLQEEERLLSNFDKIYSTLHEIKAFSEDLNFMEHFYEIVTRLEKVSSVNQEFLEMHKNTENFYYEMDEILHQVNQKINSMNFDPDELKTIQNRLHDLETLQNKYKMTIPELIEYVVFLENEIDQSLNYEEYLEVAKRKLSFAFSKAVEAGKVLSVIRKQIAEKISNEIKVVLKDLVLANTEFRIFVTQNLPQDPFSAEKFLSYGFDEIELMISTNVGEPMKPLSKTASGGEMSRIMLAFKTIFIRSQNLSTIIFDEIDTGISGFVAKQIAKKIREISNFCQVISITHIPQVVAVGEHHLKVEKIVEGKRTIAKATYLDFNGRVRDIAQMISGEKITDSAIQNAKELLISS